MITSRVAGSASPSSSRTGRVLSALTAVGLTCGKVGGDCNSDDGPGSDGCGELSRSLVQASPVRPVWSLPPVLLAGGKSQKSPAPSYPNRNRGDDRGRDHDFL